jgi:iron complex outermembrane receptor protein
MFFSFCCRWPCDLPKNQTMSRAKIRLFIVGLAMAAGPSLSSNNAVAQTPPATQPPVTTGAATGQQQGGELERITVTGYLIPRIGEGPQPVLTLDRDFIQKQGTQSVSDVIQRLTGTPSSFTQNFATGNNGTPGANAPRLRGLPIEATLTLVDGLRWPTHAIPYNQTNAAIDINSIPLAAIDRIEVLKDGGSATYGSDAVAGVINLVIKDSYEGTDITSYFGISQRGDSETFHDSFVTGLTKPLGSGKLSVVAAFDYFQQGAIRAEDRAFTTTNYKKLSSKYRSAPPGSPVSYLGDYNDAAGNDYFTPPGTTGGRPTLLLNQMPPGYFLFTPDYWLLQPRTTRYAGLIKATYTATDWLKFYDTFLITTNHETAESPNQGVSSGPAPSGDAVGLVPLYIPATNPFNSTGQTLTFSNQSLKEFGAWKSDAWTRAYRNTIGATVQLPHNWFVDGSFTYGESDATYTLDNAVRLNQLQLALNGQLPGFIGQFFNPFVDERVAGHPNKKFYNAIRTQQWQNNRSDLILWTLKTGGTLVDLPSGPLTIAGGFEYRGESLIQGVDENSSHSNIAQGNFLGPHNDGRRYIYSLYGELDVPIFGEKWSWPGMRALDVVFSYRWDRYSDFGDAGKPKIALRYKPFDDLTFRATYAEGFVAPTLAELFGAPQFFQSGGVVDHKNPQFSFVGNPILTVNANRNLQPENSYGYYAEMVWTPDAKDSPDSWWHWLRGFSAYVDWYQIEFRNQIDYLRPQRVEDLEGALPAGTQVLRGPNGQITRLITQLTNLNRTLTDGIDIGFSYLTKEYPWGKLDIEASGTYVYNFAVRTIVPAKPRPRLQVLLEDDSFGPPTSPGSAPDFKGVASIFYSKTLFGTDTFRTGLTVNYIDSTSDFRTNFKGSNPSAGLDSPKFVHEIGSWTTVDWQISYAFGAPAAAVAETAKPGFDKDGKRIIGEKAIPPVRGEGSSGGLRKWLANTTMTFGINNIWDSRAPLAESRAISFGYDYNYTNPIQRFFYVQLEKRF